MYMHILLALVTVLVFLWYKQRKRKLQVFKRLGIPGPEPNILFGNFLEIVRRGPIVCHNEWIEKYGKVVGYYYGNKAILIVTDLELMKNVLIKDFQKFTDRPSIFREVTQPISSKDRRSLHLISLKGKQWKDIRSLVTPSFTTSKMRMMTPIMDECIDILLENIEEKRVSGKSFDIYALYKRLTMDVITRTAFGIQTNVQKNPNAPVFKLSNLLLTSPYRFYVLLVTCTFFVIRPVIAFFFSLTSTIVNKGYNPVEELMDRCEAVIKARLNDPSLKRKDMLQLMMDTELKKNVSDEALAAGEENEKQDTRNSDITDANKDKANRRLTIDQVVSNSLVFLIAGFETTSTALAFSTMILVHRPDVQEKIRDEVNDSLVNGGKLDYGSINQLQYLDQVFREILRLYPPVYQFVHRESEETVSYGNITIPKGTVVQMPTFSIHHDPNNWPDPYEFKPERFAPENRNNINPLAWQPFGAGPRNCVGMRFAQMEAKMAIAKLLHKYKFLPTEKTDKHPLQLSYSPIIIRPKYGVPIKVELA